MIMNERSVNFQYRARYFENGNPKTAKELWIVLHGHGQLAQYFIQKFQQLDSNQYYLVAPEGLSRYYLSGYSGRVGATWMTKEDRLADIDNYVNYLNTVYKNVTTNLRKGIKITVLGFSQGTATVSRWIAQSEVKIDRLILWAGLFPEDINFKLAHERFGNIEILNVYGKNDEFLNDKHLAKQQEIIKKLDIQPTTIVFDGNHSIHNQTLMKVATNSY